MSCEDLRRGRPVRRAAFNVDPVDPGRRSCGVQATGPLAYKRLWIGRKQKGVGEVVEKGAVSRSERGQVIKGCKGGRLRTRFDRVS